MLMHSHFLPCSIHKVNLIGQHILISQCVHDLAYLSITLLEEYLYLSSQFLLSLKEVIIELLHKLLTVSQSRDVSLSSRVLLSLNHGLSLV